MDIHHILGYEILQTFPLKNFKETKKIGCFIQEDIGII